MDQDLTSLVGVRTATALAKLNLKTGSDLLNHFPRRYSDPGKLTDIASLEIGEHVTVEARIKSVTVREMATRGGAILQAKITDGKNELSLLFFAKRKGALRPHESRLIVGEVGYFTGTVSDYRGAKQLTHPDYLILGQDANGEAEALAEVSRLVPIYPACSAIATWRIDKAVKTVLNPLREQDFSEPLTPELRSAYKVLSLAEAYRKIHQPNDTQDWVRARQTFGFLEALSLQLVLARRRAKNHDQVALPRVVTAKSPGFLAHFDAHLPFELTAGQIKVGLEIASDLQSNNPMMRLLQGDVGAGKTIVALRAMLQVADAGGQSALLAPTEVLAFQHYKSIQKLLGELSQEGLFAAQDLNLKVVCLTSSMPAAQRRQALADIASGTGVIVVGTHALLAERVQFADLGLVVVDEQHRFGVEQRDALRIQKDQMAHLLVMTATPIPRTIAMTVFGDLMVSTLDQLPAGRAEVQTIVVPAANERWLQRIWERIAEECAQGGRAYVVCPRIDPTLGTEYDADLVADIDFDAGADAGAGSQRQDPPLASVTELFAELQRKGELAGLKLEQLHGQLASVEKDAVMQRFASGESQVLVATTVIEVGVDVPQATVMVIMNAERFGISQLHQLRGRIGRGNKPGVCLLVSGAEPGTVAHERLQALVATRDGFELATKDLELRREGDVLGAVQSGGRSSLKLLRVMKDANTIVKARKLAQELIDQDVQLEAWGQLAKIVAEYEADATNEYLAKG